jgi:hypothetical protein
MKYDSRKTLSENKEILLESGKCYKNGQYSCWCDESTGKETKTYSNTLKNFIDSNSFFNLYYGSGQSWSAVHPYPCYWGFYGPKKPLPSKDKRNFSLDEYHGGQEMFGISPKSEGISKIRLIIFKDRKDSLVDNITKLIGKYTKEDTDGTYRWDKNDVNDQTVISITNTILGNKNKVTPKNTQTTQNKTSQITSQPEIGLKDTITKDGFDFQKIKQEFGSSGSAEDNMKLLNAWKAGWRPGNEIPTEFKIKRENISITKSDNVTNSKSQIGTGGAETSNTYGTQGGYSFDLD